MTATLDDHQVVDVDEGVDVADSGVRWWIKPVIGIVLLAAILFAAPIYGRLVSGGKISAEIDRNAATVDIVVDLPFVAETYHRETLSDLGVYSGRDRNDDTRYRLRAVSQDQLESIANLYWVEGILPAGGS